MFNYKIMTILVCAGVILSPCVFADNAQRDQTLVQIVDQLNAVLPLIDIAERQQDKNTTVQFHFETWVDGNGVRHNGLRQDLLDVRQGVIDQINQPTIEPRTIQPLNKDFIGATP